jgi:beta-N-acetylhexosaminidase
MLLVPVSTARPAAIHRADSLAIKIGQMIMVGFRGFEAGESSAIVKDIRYVGIGGVVLFDYDVEKKSPVRNIESPRQLRALTRALRGCSEIPLFIAVDQEGGRVARLKPKNGFPATVSQQYLGRLNDPDSTRESASRIAAVLRDCGINVDFAPVADVNVNPLNPVIGKLERSFSADPGIVAKQSKAVIDALHAGKVLASVKHFPGHGSSRTDSHEGFTDVSETWTRAELQPFASLIGSGDCDFVMTAHIFNRHLDPEHPATLSRAIVGRLLRDSLGYAGVVISDDMQMKAVTSRYGLEAAVRLAIEAGVDILLFGNNAGVFDENIASKAATIIRDLVGKGLIPESRIDESFGRIMALKEKMAKW